MSSANLPAVAGRVAPERVEEPTAPAPLRIDEIQHIAQQIARSRLYGMDESQAFTLMLLAHAKGLHPVQAVERYHVIQGRPAMKADAMLADFQSRGGVVTWHRHDEQACEATFHCPGLGEPLTVGWTTQDAKRAGLGGKDMWAKFPRQMLRARVISEGVRMAMPAILCGIYTPEEVADFGAPAPAPARPNPPPAASRRDGRSLRDLISDGLKAKADRFHAAWPEGWDRPNLYSFEQHLRKFVERELPPDAPDWAAETKLSQHVLAEKLGRLYHGPHRKAIRAEVGRYLGELDARAQARIDLHGEPAEPETTPEEQTQEPPPGGHGDTDEPDVDYPDDYSDEPAQGD